MKQVGREAYNHVERRGSQGKRNGNGGDLVHWSFQVSVPLDALEQPLLLSWPKWWAPNSSFPEIVTTKQLNTCVHYRGSCHYQIFFHQTSDLKIKMSTNTGGLQLIEREEPQRGFSSINTELTVALVFVL